MQVEGMPLALLVNQASAHGRLVDDALDVRIERVPEPVHVAREPASIGGQELLPLAGAHDRRFGVARVAHA